MRNYNLRQNPLTKLVRNRKYIQVKNKANASVENASDKTLMFEVTLNY